MYTIHCIWGSYYETLRAIIIFQKELTFRLIDDYLGHLINGMIHNGMKNMKSSTGIEPKSKFINKDSRIAYTTTDYTV